MATEHTKHQVKSEERQDVVKDLTRVMLAYYWRDLHNFYHDRFIDLRFVYKCYCVDEIRDSQLILIKTCMVK